MSKIPVWIDCDPGVDDSAAILAALQMPELDILGISAVSGNVLLNHTFRNARSLVELGGRGDIPVYPGAASPMRRESLTAAYVHGMNGLGDVEIPDPVVPAKTEMAWDALYKAAKAHPNELVLIAVGPLTNIGMAFAKYGELPKLIKEIIIMGGSASVGNTTPAAEFNILVDPEAADIMFASDAHITMCGLDVTLKAMIMPNEIEEIGKLGTQGKFLRDALQCSLKFVSQFGFPGVPLHDVCAVFYAVYPELFSGDEAGVRVETEGEFTLGKTVTDLYSDYQMEKKNTFVVLDVNREGFVKKFTELMENYR